MLENEFIDRCFSNKTQEMFGLNQETDAVGFEERQRLTCLAISRKRQRIVFLNSDDGVRLRLLVRGHEQRQQKRDQYCVSCGGNNDGWRGRRSTFKCSICGTHFCVRVAA